MVKTNKHIEIVRSSVPSLSSMGKKSCDMIKGILEQHYERVGVTTINNLYDLEVLVTKQPDLVFLGVKKLPVGDNTAAKVWTSAYLDEKGINYTGSTAAAITLDFNKPMAKQAVKAAKLNTAAYFIASQGQYQSTYELPLNLPLFIKPPNTGGGQGIGADSVARDFAAFEQKVQSIASNFQSVALVEEYLIGREFSVAILATVGSAKLIAMPVELITEKNYQGDRILGKKVKTEDTEHVTNITGLKLKKAINELAINVFKVLGARDYGRIDIRLDAQGTPHFIEANLIPGLAQHDFTSYFTTACWINQAMNYETMILHIVELGLARNPDMPKSVSEHSSTYHTGLPSPAFAFESAV